MNEFEKEKVETADFSALKWKLHGVNVNPQVRRVLEVLWRHYVLTSGLKTQPPVIRKQLIFLQWLKIKTGPTVYFEFPLLNL